MGRDWGRLLRTVLVIVLVVVLLPIVLVAFVFLFSFLSPNTMMNVPAKSLLALAIGAMLLLALALLARAVYGILLGRMPVGTAIKWFFGALAGTFVAVLGAQIVRALGHSRIAHYGYGPGIGRFHLPGFEWIYSTWTGVAVVWLGALIIAGIIGQSGINHRARRAITVIGPLGSLAIAWAVFADGGRIGYGSSVPPLDPTFFTLWGLAMLGVLPVLFVLLGGIHTNTYHPNWAPYAMMTKAASFLASLLSIWGFIVQNRHF